jgi:winged helix DNA-binding protein
VAEPAERAVGVIERALADEGPLTRVQLRERIAAKGIRTEGQALVHLLMRACLRGVAVRGPMVGGHHAYALVGDWLGAQPPAREALLAGNASVVTVNGLFRPFALVRGRAAATWSISAGRIVMHPFARLTRRDESALRRDGLDVARYLGSAIEEIVLDRAVG